MAGTVLNETLRLLRERGWGGGEVGRLITLSEM